MVSAGATEYVLKTDRQNNFGYTEENEADDHPYLQAFWQAVAAKSPTKKIQGE